MNHSGRKSRKRHQLSLYLIGVALVAALLGLMGAMGLLNQQSDKLNADFQSQTDINDRLREVLQLSRLLHSAESSQRGFLLTGDRSYLEPYVRASGQMPALIDKLDELTEPHPEVEPLVADARVALATKLPELQETIRLYQAGNVDEAMALVRSGTGANSMAQAVLLLDSIVDIIRRDRNTSSQEILAASSSAKSLAYTALWALEVFTLLAIVQIVLLLQARTRYEKDLSTSELRYRNIVEEQSELVSLATSDGLLTYVNPAYARHFSTTTEALTGQNLFDHVDPSDVERVRQTILEVFRTGVASRAENRMRSPDGREKWVAWTNSLQVADDGTQKLHSVGRDISEQRLAERALRQSQEFLERTGRVGGVGGWEIDLTTSTVTWSDQVRRIHEVEPSFVPNIQAAMEFFDESARDRVELAGRDAVLYGAPYDLELPLTTAKGRSICVRIVGEVEHDEKGRPVRLVGALQDVTERKKLQDQVRESERFLLEITDNVSVGMSFVDLQGRYQFVNRALADRLGMSRNEILGRTRAEISDTPTHVLQQKLDDIRRGEQQEFLVEEMHDGRLHLFETQLFPAYDLQHNVRGFYSTGVDITALKKTEQQLRELTEILEYTPDFIFQTDARGLIQYMNPAARRRLRLPDDGSRELVLQQFFEPEASRQIDQEILPRVMESGLWMGETHVVDSDCLLIPVHQLVIGHRGAGDELLRFSAVLRDISDVVAARADLERQTTTLESIIEATPALVAVFDKELRYRLVNREFERQRGVDRSVVIGRTVAELYGEAEWNRRLPQVQRVMSGETFNFERADHVSRNVRFVNVTYIPLRLADGSVDGFISIAQDITTHREEELRLRSLSETDALTGLLNRAGFLAALSRSLEQREFGVALLYIDLDRFKPVNDTYGHAAGDEVLRQLAQRFRGLVRPTDPVARLGGDEFAIILIGMREKKGAEAVARKVVDAASRPFELESCSIEIGASVGIAIAAPDEDGKQLLARADALVYAAKAAGRGRVAA